MRNLFDETKAKQFQNDPLAMRVYTSNILGVDQDLVLHGGGNTSVKIEDTLYVKGSGWNLDTIQKEGFAPVDLETLKDMAKLSSLSDSNMVKMQKEAMKDKSAPNPSIEAILHAIIPFKYVDHTHADAVVTISNTPNGKDILQKIYGENMLIVPYVMPGFLLAKKVYEMTKDIDFKSLEGIILLNHGVFTFDDDARKSYDKMIKIVNKSEKYLEDFIPDFPKQETDIPKDIIESLENLLGCAVIPNTTALARYFTTLNDIDYSPLTPEHVIRTKAKPMILSKDIKNDIKTYKQEYENYFKRNDSGDKTMLNPNPKYAVLRGYGILNFGKDVKEANIINDITAHTAKAMILAQNIDRWQGLKESDLFDMEYWELEQAKLKKAAAK